MNRAVTIIIVQAIITAVAITCAFIFAINPLLSRLLDNQSKINDMSQELSITQDKLTQLKTLEKQKDNIGSIILAVNGYLPDDSEASEFIVHLEKTTSQIPVVIDSLSVTESKTTTSKSASKTTDSSDESSSKKSNSNSDTSSSTSKTTSSKASSEKSLTFSASFKSNYDNIITFFQQMETFSRFNTIESISLSGYNEKDGVMNLKIDGKLYYGK